MLIVVLIYIMLLAIVLGLGYWSYVIGRREWSDAAGDVIPVTYFFVGLLLAGMIQGSMQETVTLIVGGLLLSVANFGLFLWGKHRASKA
ncbi:hypothetical protein [Lactiplantibacillus herbarum]|uniref:hypothetical protein n=1 Tax=Lactiplantibacillus herbarum TaxID=1670446 RepID=UPI00064FE453|nr:hypothetical protein [Lactiplantibacillus herbarum]